MNSFKKISQIQRNLVLIFYIVFCLALIYTVWSLFSNLKILFSVNLVVIVLIIILFSLFGSYYYLIVFLPEKLNKNFDVIRNGIASGKINSLEKFSLEVIEFLVENFNYIFFDVEYAAVGVDQNKEMYFSKDLNPNIIDKKNELFIKSNKSENVEYLGTIKVLEKKSYVYLIPVWFDNKYLGFFLVITNKKLGSLFKGILLDFERYYLDDQFMLMCKLSKINFENISCNEDA